jgi:uncharacterized protein (TIGR00297 family)
MATDPIHSPAFRNLVHVGAFVIFAPLFGLLADPRNKIAHGHYYVVGYMLFITLLNIFLLPHLKSGKLIARPGEGFIAGQWLYPAALALCFAAFPPFAAMGAWAAMASGDAAASFAGRLIPKPKLHWNDKKTYAGTLAFVLVALPFCVFAIYWCPSQQFLKSDGNPEWPFVWTLAVLAAVVGAALESLDGPFDDNLRVPIGVSTMLWLAGAFLSYSTRDLPADTPVQPEVFLKALLVNGILGLAIILLRAADFPGTLLGVAIGTVVFFFTQWPGYILFLLFVSIGSGLSKVGLKRKQEIGAAEAREGKRGIGNVAANLLVPGLCCLAYPASGGHPAFLMAFAGAIAAAFADTASSEVGALSDAQPVLITTFKPAAHGTNGAVTLLGFAAAFGAGALIAVAAWAGGFFGMLWKIPEATFETKTILSAVFVIVAGLVGTLVDSLLGATVEDRLPGVHKGAVNFACTLAGALVAGGLSCTLSTFGQQ